ncbi:MAG: ABC transporter ATP-binding protein, partial [Planctomycetia bacterium]
IRFDGVWKKFSRSDRHRSLRDALPAMAKSLFGRRAPTAVDGLEPHEFYSLRDLSFSVRSGECLGVVGPNGAGKSTVLKCASRILRPNRGKVTVKGRVSALIEVGAGFHPDLTGRENVFLNGTILGMRRRDVADRFDRIVEFSGLADFIHMPVKRYSSGMYARLGFAVAAFMDPDVLLIDEVLAVGDMNFARKCVQKIRETQQAGAAVLFISHNLSDIRLVCDRVLLIGHGACSFDGPPDEGIHRYLASLAAGDNTGCGHPAVGRLTVGLSDAVGNPVFSAAPGGVLHVDVELTAASAIAETSVGITVVDAHNQEVYGCRIDTLGHDPVDLPASGKLTVRFQLETNLAPGSYSIGTVVRGRPETDGFAHPMSLEQNPHRLQLTVQGATESWGPANLFAACETTLEPAPDEPTARRPDERLTAVGGRS